MRFEPGRDLETGVGIAFQLRAMELDHRHYQQRHQQHQCGKQRHGPARSGGEGVVFLIDGRCAGLRDRRSATADFLPVHYGTRSGITKASKRSSGRGLLKK